MRKSSLYAAVCLAATFVLTLTACGGEKNEVNKLDTLQKDVSGLKGSVADVTERITKLEAATARPVLGLEQAEKLLGDGEAAISVKEFRANRHFAATVGLLDDKVEEQFAAAKSAADAAAAKAAADRETAKQELAVVQKQAAELLAAAQKAAAEKIAPANAAAKAAADRQAILAKMARKLGIKPSAAPPPAS